MSFSRKTIVFFFFLLFAVGCGKKQKDFTIMPDMAYSPAIKAQEEGSMKTPPAGTIATDYMPYPYPDSPEKAAGLPNPLKRDLETIRRGQNQYNTFCTVCHGELGDGKGKIPTKYLLPPALITEKMENWKDGQIYHVITMGQNSMGSYAHAIAPKDRWAIVHYIRVLQRAANPTDADLKALEKWKEE